MRNRLQLIGLLVLTAMIVGGCDPRPGTPWTKWYKPTKVLNVAPADMQEVLLVDALEQARSNYHALLVAQEDYYVLIGDDQKQAWANKERTNLDKAQTFRFEPAPKLAAPAPKRAVGAAGDERALVEDVLAARTIYLKSLDQLAVHYEANTAKDGQFKAYVIHTVQDRFRAEKTYRYVRVSQLPPLTLKPTKNIPAANAMYDAAWKLHRDGSRIPAFADYDKQREALKTFESMIAKYPNSTRIAVAAFHIGEIYKEYFREYYLATLWYDRAVHWHPNIEKPVRFQTAVQYDINLGEKARALRYYRAAMKYEPYFNSNGNYRYSIQRVRELEDILRREGKPVPQDCFEPGEKPWNQRPENRAKVTPAPLGWSRPWYDPFGLFTSAPVAPPAPTPAPAPPAPVALPAPVAPPAPAPAPMADPVPVPAPLPAPAPALKAPPAPAPAPMADPVPVPAPLPAPAPALKAPPRAEGEEWD